MTAADARVVLEAAHEFEWPDPEPLVAPTEAPRPYPLDALQPIVRNAVTAYQAYGQQPKALVACSALASASLAVQGLVDVARDRNLIGPTSLNIMVIAESGERKTSADQRLTRAARQWQTDRCEAMKPEADAARAAVAAHAAERDGVIAKIKSTASKGSINAEADLVKLRQRLRDLEAAKPVEPVVPSLFHEDATPEALAQSIAFGWPSSSLWSDEAGLFIGGHGMSDDSAMRYLTLLNRLWDGLPFERKRMTAKSFTIRGRRLTCSLMMQEVVLARLLAAGGGISRGVGFLARFLVAWPSSTMGRRLYHDGDMDGPALAAFDARIRELLDAPLPVEGDGMVLHPKILEMSRAARRAWIAYHDDVEQELGRFGEFCDVSDFAAKSAENAARVAAVLHVFENGPGGELSVDVMECGAEVAAWHLFEARRIMGAIETPQAVADALLLIDWLLSQTANAVPLKRVSQYGPARLRGKSRRDTAINLLVETHQVAEVRIAGATMLRVNPKLRRKT